MKKEKNRKDLFRYGIISPLVHEEENKIRDKCAHLSEKEYWYKGKIYKYSKETIRKWYYKYKKEGFDSLNNKERRDKKESRKLTEEQEKYIIQQKEKYPKITTKRIYEKMKKEGMIKEGMKIDTLYRYIKGKKLTRKIITEKERRRYEKEYPNDTWQGDTTYGPYITIKGKKYRVYLIQFIDDNSRLIVGYGFYLNDNANNVRKVLKKAIGTYGKPKQIYLDNGKSYRNEQMEIICARLGIKLTYTHAYDPEAKGKVERCFRTIKEGWMNASDWNKYKTIEDIEEEYKKYLYENYINKEHSELKETPNNVWHKGIKKTKLREVKEEDLEEAFMVTIKRKVGKDRTISFNKKLYEVPFKYVGEEIEIRYKVEEKKEEEIELWIFENNKKVAKCNLLNKKENGRVKRKNNIDYEKLVNKEEEVYEYGEEK